MRLFNDNEDDINHTKANLDWAKDVPCRNITIHGFCKYEGKGCSFKHDDSKRNNTAAISNNSVPLDPTKNISINDLSLSTRPPSASSTVTNPSLADSKKKFNLAASTFLPSSAISNAPSLAPTTKSVNKFSTLSPKLSDIPSFVPSGTFGEADSQSAANKFNLDSPAFLPASEVPSTLNRSPVPTNPYLAQPTDQVQPNPYAQTTDSLNPYASIGTSHQDFLYPQSSYPLQYHLYAPAPPPHLQIPLKGNEQTAETLFIPNELRETLLKKNESTLKTLPHSNLPELVGVYYSLVPLDNSLNKSDTTYGYNSSLYKAFSNVDGRAYVLRRIESVKISKDKSLSTINRWIRFKNSNVANVVDAFTSRSFGDNSLIVVYDYYPNSKNLIEQHFHSNLGGKPEPITPRALWGYTTQLTGAIASAHSKNLSIRSISLQKAIITSKNRLRLSDCGIFDILDYDEETSEEKLQELKQRDLKKLGEVLLTLAASASPGASKFSTKKDIIANLDNMDDAFKEALSYLLSDESELSVKEFQKLIAPQLFEELSRVEESADYYEAQLTRELENARLVRLLTKLNFITDRPEYTQNAAWSQSGERYPIKLFREYVFHQVDERGKPVLDLAFVLKTLNKLDAGIDEKILLVSHDEQTCLIVSYKEMKDLIERSFRELSN